MQLKSDVVIEAVKFDPASVSEQASQFNRYLIDLTSKAPQWYEVRLDI